MGGGDMNEGPRLLGSGFYLVAIELMGISERGFASCCQGQHHARSKTKDLNSVFATGQNRAWASF